MNEGFETTFPNENVNIVDPIQDLDGIMDWVEMNSLLFDNEDILAQQILQELSDMVQTTVSNASSPGAEEHRVENRDIRPSSVAHSEGFPINLTTDNHVRAESMRSTFAASNSSVIEGHSRLEENQSMTDALCDGTPMVASAATANNNQGVGHYCLAEGINDGVTHDGTNQALEGSRLQEETFSEVKRTVPKPEDTCFGLIDHPGTIEWREIIHSLSNQPWSNELYMSIRRRLQGRRFLICRNANWFLASETDIWQKTRQRFKDSQKPRSSRPRGRPPGAPRSTGEVNATQTAPGWIQVVDELLAFLENEITTCQHAVNIVVPGHGGYWEYKQSMLVQLKSLILDTFYPVQVGIMRSDGNGVVLDQEFNDDGDDDQRRLMDVDDDDEEDE